MALPAPVKRYTPQEYLRLEDAALDKHEYHAGEILAMSGGTYRQSRAAANVTGELYSRLKGSPCYMLESNMRVRIADDDRYVYPDAMIVCGEAKFDPLDENQTTILNPKVVIEVLSASTEAYDRGAKFTAYRTLDSMQEYVLVSQHRALVETFFRQDDGNWLFSAWQGRDATATLRSVKVDLPLSDIYAGVNFPADLKPDAPAD